MVTGRNTAETVIAVSAIVTAVIALTVGVWENVQERHHNRLSVVPSLVYFLEVTGNRESDGKPAATLRLVNQGMGPALVQNSSVVITGDTGATHTFPGLLEAAPVLADLGVELRSRAGLSEGTVVGSGQEVQLARFEFLTASPDDDTYAQVRSLLSRFEYTIDYESIYGDAFQASLSR